jgi:hypothetical protein
MKLADRVIDVLVDYSQGLITTQKLTARPTITYFERR